MAKSFLAQLWVALFVLYTSFWGLERAYIGHLASKPFKHADEGRSLKIFIYEKNRSDSNLARNIYIMCKY